MSRLWPELADDMPSGISSGLDPRNTDPKQDHKPNECVKCFSRKVKSMWTPKGWDCRCEGCGREWSEEWRRMF